MTTQKVALNPPPSVISDKNHYAWENWFNSVYNRIGNGGPFAIQGYAVAALPSAPTWGSLASGDPFSSIIFVYNESGGPTIAFSDGTNWRRVTDRAIVS